jgi:hypothetical protein
MIVGTAEIPLGYVTISAFVGAVIMLGGRIIFDWLKSGRNGKNGKNPCDPKCKEDVNDILHRVKTIDCIKSDMKNMNMNSQEQTLILRDIKTVIVKNNDLFHEFLGRARRDRK